MVDTSDLERMPVQLVAKEAIAAAMETPLREPILDAVEETAGPVESEPSDDERPAAGTGSVVDVEHTGGSSSGRRSTFLQGLVTFLVMFGVLYALLRRLTGEE